MYELDEVLEYEDDGDDGMISRLGCYELQHGGQTPLMEALTLH